MAPHTTHTTTIATMLKAAACIESRHTAGRTVVTKMKRRRLAIYHFEKAMLPSVPDAPNTTSVSVTASGDIPATRPRNGSM